MKLSEAIRLGAMLRPKADGRFFFEGASCAGGAALEAVGVPYGEKRPAWDFHDEILNRWPMVLTYATCPSCGIRVRVRGLIPHLNNRNGHGWTREQIADWVEQIEARQALVPIPEDAQAVTA